MKKIMLNLKAVALLLALQGCSEFNLGPNVVIPNCSWDSAENIMFNNLQLIYPSGLSPFHQSTLPNGGIDRSFIDLVTRNSDQWPKTANIRVDVKSDGTKCLGDKTTNYNFDNYYNGLGGNMIRSPWPSIASFIGEITVTLESNTYNNTVGSGGYYHILWEQTGNSPNGGMNGTMYGKKISTFSLYGKEYLDPWMFYVNNYYYSDGELEMLY